MRMCYHANMLPCEYAIMQMFFHADMLSKPTMRMYHHANTLSREHECAVMRIFMRWCFYITVPLLFHSLYAYCSGLNHLQLAVAIFVVKAFVQRGRPQASHSSSRYAPGHRHHSLSPSPSIRRGAHGRSLSRSPTPSISPWVLNHRKIRNTCTEADA